MKNQSKFLLAFILFLSFKLNAFEHPMHSVNSCDEFIEEIHQTLVLSSSLEMEQELLMLKNTTQSIIRRTNTKRYFYPNETLKSGLSYMEQMEELRHKISALQFFLVEAKADFRRWRSYLLEQDHGPYIEDMITSSLAFGYRSITNLQELELYKIIAEKALLILSDSLFTRTKPYTCAQDQLKMLLRGLENGAFGDATKITLSRNYLINAKKHLIRGCVN